MADPLSVTLTVLTLATALKDIIELGEKIEESFAKVSRNLRNAQHLASETTKTLHQLQEFCDQNYAVLNASHEMKIELRNLATKMNSVHTICHTLIPPSTEKETGRRHRIRMAFHAWRNRDKIEEKLMDLRNDVSKCHVRFTMFAVMRLEVKLIELKQATDERAVDIIGEISSLKVSDECICSFSGPDNTLTISPTTEMAEDVVADMYLRLQMDTISKLLDQVSTTQFVHQSKIANLPFSLSINGHNSGDRKVLHNKTVSLAFQVQDLLKSRMASTTIPTGARILNNIAVRLQTLDMPKEALKIGLWAVKVYQHLVSVDSMTYTPHLVSELENLSNYYTDTGDHDAALVSITDAVEIIRSFEPQSKSIVTRIQLGSILATYANILGLKHKHETSLEIAQEAVMILNNPFQPAIAHDPESAETPSESDSSLIETLQNLPQEHTRRLWYTYSRALRQLSKSLQGIGHIQESIDFKLKALRILRELDALRDIGLSVKLDIAATSYELLQARVDPHLPRETWLLYAEECIDIYTKYADWHPFHYGRSLCNAFCEKAMILGDLGRHEEALETWKATLQLAKKFVRGQWYLSTVLAKITPTLRIAGRHSDVKTWVITPVDKSIPEANSAAQAYGYGALSTWLHETKRYTEAIEVGRHAVSQYRILAKDDPQTFTKDLAYAYSQLSRVYVDAGLYDYAIEANKQAFTIYENLTSSDRSLITFYRLSLLVGGSTASKSTNESKAIKHHQEVVRSCERFTIRYPEEAGLIAVNQTVSLHLNFDRFDRLTEAQSVLEALLEKWDHTNHPLNNAKAITAYLTASILRSKALDSQGCTERALECLEGALSVSIPFCAKDVDVASTVAALMLYRVLRLCDLGRYAEALQVGKVTMPKLFWKAPPHPEDTNDFVWNRLALAHALQYHYEKAEEVINTANDAIMVCQREDFVKRSKTAPSLRLYLPQSLRYLAIGLGDRGDKLDALVNAKLALKEATLLQSDTSRKFWEQSGQPLYVVIRVTLAACLIETGDLAEAIDNLAEVQAYRESRAKYRHQNCVILANVLHVIGILHCTLGRHEEGIIAANDLSKLKRRLGSAIPSLARQIELQAEHEMKRVGATNLRRLKAGLTCRHQDDH